MLTFDSGMLSNEGESTNGCKKKDGNFIVFADCF